MSPRLRSIKLLYMSFARSWHELVFEYFFESSSWELILEHLRRQNSTMQLHPLAIAMMPESVSDHHKSPNLWKSSLMTVVKFLLQWCILYPWKVFILGLWYPCTELRSLLEAALRLFFHCPNPSNIRGSTICDCCTTVYPFSILVPFSYSFLLPE